MTADLLRNTARQQISTTTRLVPSSKQAMQRLKLAVELGDISLCKRAIAEGASPEDDLPGCRNINAVSLCAQLHSPEIAQFLVSNGLSSIDIGQGKTLFHFAAEQNDQRLMKTLLETHSAELLQNAGVQHPMHSAIWASAQECFDLMLDHTYSSSTLRPADSELGDPPTRNFSAANIGSAKVFLANVPVGKTSNSKWRSNLEVDWNAFYLYTPLHLAAKVGSLRFTKRLVAAGSQIDAVASFYDTPLHLAADCSGHAMAEMPLDSGVGTSARDINPRNPASAVALVELLLDSGANTFARDINLKTPAMKAAESGHLSVLKPLLRNGVDTQARECRGNTILHLAALSGCTECLAYILNISKSFDLETECAQGYSVLQLAHGVDNGNGLSIPSFLLNLAPRSQAYNSRISSVLAFSIVNTNTTVKGLRLLLKRLPCELLLPILNRPCQRFGTPLCVACIQIGTHRETGIINLLLDAGALIDQHGGLYDSPLMAACTKGRLSAVKILIARGAQITLSREGQTISALHAARNFPDIVHWLLVGRFTEGPRLLEWT